MERTATVSMKSAKILTLLRGPGIRFDPISDRRVRVYWEPNYDERIGAQSSVWDFPAADRQAIQAKLSMAAGRMRKKGKDYTDVYLRNGDTTEYVGRIHQDRNSVRQQFRDLGYTAYAMGRFDPSPSAFAHHGLLISKPPGGTLRMSTGAMRTKSRAARRAGVR